MSYINREEAIKTIAGLDLIGNDFAFAQNLAQAWLKNEEFIPSADVVEVVRCKDCKYGDTGIDEEGKKFWKCLGIHYGGTKPNDYCSYGERRSDEWERKDDD